MIEPRPTICTSCMAIHSRDTLVPVACPCCGRPVGCFEHTAHEAIAHVERCEMNHAFFRNKFDNLQIVKAIKETLMDWTGIETEELNDASSYTLLLGDQKVCTPYRIQFVKENIPRETTLEDLRCAAHLNMVGEFFASIMRDRPKVIGFLTANTELPNPRNESNRQTSD